MKRFRGGPLGDGPFNPWAKMIALEQLLRDEHVDLRLDSLVFDVEREGRDVTAAWAATPDGVCRFEAAAFVDGTGDGDLCAMAGADFRLGRESDGLLHAFTQSSGRLREVRGRPRMDVVNFNAGHCDPTDPEDLTRARLEGIRQYLLDSYQNYSRPTYIAPAIGLRQARQVVTEYVLTLDDQISSREFDDPIGYTGSHYDNHATDFEFESDEAVFWLWANRQYFLPISCQLSYRSIVPRGLANVWVASRCLGVTQDAHYSTRMQRDVQRIGEVAGYAAAEAARTGDEALKVPYENLRRRLERTGALGGTPRRFNVGFGAFDFGGKAPELDSSREEKESAFVDEALAMLDRGEPGRAIWWLYRHELLVRDQVLQRLSSDDVKPMTSWLAASIAAMWCDPAAEPRLIEAIETSEYGFDDERYEWTPPNGLYKADGFNPLEWNKVVPNWLCAVALLRCCGTERCLPAIEALLKRSTHGLDTLTTVAITLERLIVRRGLASAAGRQRISAMVDRIGEARVVGNVSHVERPVGRYSEGAVRGQFDDRGPGSSSEQNGADIPDQIKNTFTDSIWQLHLVVARLRVALGISADREVRNYLRDDRALVRRAFESLTGR